MRTNIKTGATSFTNSFLLLVIVASVLNGDLFESDAVLGYHEHKVLYPIELVFNAEYPPQSTAFSISQKATGIDVVEDSVLSARFNIRGCSATLFLHGTGQVNTRPIYSSKNHTGSFNIPHQNSDEEEAFVSPLDVA